MTKNQDTYIITVDGKMTGLTNYYGLLTLEEAKAHVDYFAGETREVIGYQKWGAR